MATETRRSRILIEDWTGVTTSNVIPANQERWYDTVTGYQTTEIIRLVGDGVLTIAALLKRQELTDGAQTLYGVKTFDDIPVLPATAPTSDNQSMSKVHTEALLGLPTKYITGFTIDNNSTDANNDIDIFEGRCRDFADTLDIETDSTLVKRLDAAWAVGTGNGGLDTGSKASSTTYYVFVISKDSDGTVDALFSLSDTSPTLPSGWSTYRILAVIYTDSSGDIYGYTQPNGYERKFYDYSNTSAVSNTWGDGHYKVIIRDSSDSSGITALIQVNEAEATITANFQSADGGSTNDWRVFFTISTGNFSTTSVGGTYYIAEIHKLTGKLRLDE